MLNILANSFAVATRVSTPSTTEKHMSDMADHLENQVDWARPKFKRPQGWGSLRTCRSFPVSDRPCATPQTARP